MSRGEEALSVIDSAGPDGGRTATDGQVEASRHLVTVRIGGLRCGLPLTDVVQVLAAATTDPLPGGPAAVLGVLDLHGDVIAVLDGRACLGLPPTPLRGDDRFVVLAVEGGRQALRVDAVDDLVEVSADAITDAASLGPATMSVAGIARLEDGLLVIHDPTRFLSPQDAGALASALTERTAGTRR